MAEHIEQLVNAQAAARQRVERAALGLIRRLIAAMVGQWYSDAAVRAFKTQVIEIVFEAQRAVGGVTAEFLDQVLDELDGGPVPTGPFQLPEQLRKVDPMVEWERPAKEYRRMRSQGMSAAEAQQRAADRAELLADDDISAAQQHATVIRLADYPRVIGYRRIIHPELSQSGTCGLCAVASDRRYKIGTLMPVHARCKCSVLPITRRHDPGSALNAADIKQLYGTAGSTGAADLKKTRIWVVEHSELGPQLIAA